MPDPMFLLLRRKIRDRLVMVRQKKGSEKMKHFISRDKLSKKARRLLDGRKRLIWPRSPAPQIMENRKTYNRHRKSHDFQDDWIRGIF